MSKRHLIGRRQFLIASSACAVATAVVGPELFAGEAALPKRLALGFASLDDKSVRAASSISATDGGFISRGARVLVSGACGAASAPIERRGVELLAHYGYLDGAERRSLPFRAWAGSRVTGCQGTPVSFVMPVDQTQKLAFTVAVERGMPEGAATRREALTGSKTEIADLLVTLSLQDDAKALKLARGFYVIMPLFDNDSEPRWSDWSMEHSGGRWLMAHEGTPAPFEHFVLRIDYAKQQ